MTTKLLVIGGVGGATAAARVGRLNERAESMLLERRRARFFRKLRAALLYWWSDGRQGQPAG